MTYTKADWIAANDAVIAIEKERSALVAQTDARYQAAKERLWEVEADVPEFVAHCESCGATIFEDEPLVQYDDGACICIKCAPTWEDFQADYSGYYRIIDGEEVAYTAEAAESLVASHLAGGGALSDTFDFMITRPTVDGEGE